MKFSVQLPTEYGHAPDEFLTAAAIGEMAGAAEDAGFDAAFVTDHPIPEDEWLHSGGHHTLDPFVALGIAAAATTTLRLQTNVLVLPYRNPFLAAKGAATVDVASGGRLILGVAAGYLEGEFSAVGGGLRGAQRAQRRSHPGDEARLERGRREAHGARLRSARQHRPAPARAAAAPAYLGGRQQQAGPSVAPSSWGTAGCPSPSAPAWRGASAPARSRTSRTWRRASATPASTRRRWGAPPPST